MDISFWKNLSNSVEISYTSKLFYRQYFYKLTIHAPGCKSIHEEDISKSLAFRLNMARGYNYGGSWWDRRMKEWVDAADIKFLKILQDIKEKTTNVKIRTEEPKFQIYAKTEQELKTIIDSIPKEYFSNILSFVGPKNDQARELLNSNKVLVHKEPKFQFKVTFREKRYSLESRKAVYDYLTQLDTLVHIPKTCQEQLTRKGDSMWGAYFYTNDSGVATMLQLIHPDFIREVSELVYVQE